MILSEMGPGDAQSGIVFGEGDKVCRTCYDPRNGRYILCIGELETPIGVGTVPDRTVEVEPRLQLAFMNRKSVVTVRKWLYSLLVKMDGGLGREFGAGS